MLDKKWEYNEEVHQLFIDFKKAYDSVRTEVLYKILIVFGIPKKLVRLIKISLFIVFVINLFRQLFYLTVLNMQL